MKDEALNWTLLLDFHCKDCLESPFYAISTELLWPGRKSEYPYALWLPKATKQDKFFSLNGNFTFYKTLVAQEGHLALSTLNMLEVFLSNIFLFYFIFLKCQ